MFKSIGKFDFYKKLPEVPALPTLKFHTAAWNQDSNLANIAWKCIMVMPALLLQKPAQTSKAKDHKESLQRRLVLWRTSDLLSLLKETETIQKRLKDKTHSLDIEAISKRFSALMKRGKTSAAIKLLTANMEGGILPLNEETLNLLHEKHPEPSEMSIDALVDHIPEDIHSVVFDAIDGESIIKSAIKTKGGSGPSGLDADGWRHIDDFKKFQRCK